MRIIAPLTPPDMRYLAPASRLDADFLDHADIAYRHIVAVSSATKESIKSLDRTKSMRPAVHIMSIERNSLIFPPPFA